MLNSRGRPRTKVGAKFRNHGSGSTATGIEERICAREIPERPNFLHRTFHILVRQHVSTKPITNSSTSSSSTLVRRRKV